MIENFSHTIEGFFTEPDMLFYTNVYKLLPDNAHIVEVGSFKGKSSSHMATLIANGIKNIKFDCVDTWQGNEEHQQGKMFEDLDVVHNTLYEVFINNMKPVEKFYNAIKSTSIDASKLYDDKSLDFVFIDAAHDYENVKNDIIAWKKKIKKQGMLAGHDWHHPPIKRAVSETLGKVNTINNCWFIRV